MSEFRFKDFLDDAERTLLDEHGREYENDIELADLSEGGIINEIYKYR